MNSYTLSQMEKGLTESFTITITEEHMQLFVSFLGMLAPFIWMHNMQPKEDFPVGSAMEC